MYIVILSVPDLSALEDLRDEARSLLLLVCDFHEPDLDNELTAVVLEASRRAGKFVSHLPLALREEVSI